MQVTAHASDNEVFLRDPVERSEASPKFQNASPILAGSVGVTNPSLTVRATVQFEMKLSMEPDIDTPRTLADLANEQRQFLAGIQSDYVDIDMPFDN